MPPFFVGAGQFSPVSGAVRGAAAGAQSAPARPPAQAGGWAGFAGAARKTAAAPPPGLHLRRWGAYPKSHRVKLLPQKRKKVANRHFFAMRYP